MKLYILLLWFTCVAVNAVPEKQNKIVGGSETTVSQYPEVASLLRPVWWWYTHECGGSILNSRSILTAAHCVVFVSSLNWRIRVGSRYAHSGGDIHNSAGAIYHSSFNKNTYDYDVAILRTATIIDFGTLVKQSVIAGPSYNLEDDQSVWAIGWGRTSSGGSFSSTLRHVQVWVVNQEMCKQRYAQAGSIVTDNMLCSGWLDVGGRDQCEGDDGGPLFHSKVLVGIRSWGRGCAQAFYPGVNTRVSRVSDWIKKYA